MVDGAKGFQVMVGEWGDGGNEMLKVN